jgi:hypothetical protein
MEDTHDKTGAPRQPDDPGRSRERERQDTMLDRAARQESWLSRLLRSKRERKAKPDAEKRDERVP